MSGSQNKKNAHGGGLAPVSRFQKFQPLTVARSDILNVPYNPRRISPEKRARLKAGVEKFGYVGGMVWNRRNKHLVGGEQRILILDDLHAGEPYSLTVGAVDLDDRAEKKLNVLLNNRETQGDYDTTKLRDLLDSIDGDIDGTGFAAADLEQLLGEIDSQLKTVAIAPPPKMAWVLVGIPLVKFGTINHHVEAIAAVEGTLVETTVNDDQQNEQRQEDR